MKSYIAYVRRITNNVVQGAHHLTRSKHVERTHIHRQEEKIEIVWTRHKCQQSFYFLQVTTLEKRRGRERYTTQIANE